MKSETAEAIEKWFYKLHLGWLLDGTVKGYNPLIHPYIILEGHRWHWHSPCWKVYLNTIDKGPVMQARFVYQRDANAYIETKLKEYGWKNG